MTIEDLSKDELIALHLSQEEQLTQQAQRIEALEQQLRLMLSKQYGRKSEGIPASQLALFDDDSTDEASQSESEVNDNITVSYNRKRGKRSKIKAELERRPVHYELSEADKQCECGSELKEIGSVSSEQYEYIPAQVIVIEHIQHQYACPCCEGQLILAKKPEQPLPKSNAGASLLAHISTTKYVDGVPLHRQETQLARLNIDLNRNTMARWLIQLATKFIPLMNLLEDAIRAGPLIQCDETPFQVLLESGRKATSQSYMWVRRGGALGQEVVLYRYDQHRSSSVAMELLSDYEGYVQCDGYSAYSCLESKGMTLVGCMAHARRKFNDALNALGKKESAQRTKAAKAIRYFKQLYAIEAQQKHSCDAERYLARQEQAIPILEEFKTWLDQQAHSVLPNSQLGKAVRYTLNQWPKLIRYCDKGYLPIDNNADERAIRPFAIGRRNWLFSASTDGAHTNARFYSLIETCKLHGHEPYAYLTYVFKELAAAQSVEDFEALLPWQLDAETLKQAARNV